MTPDPGAANQYGAAVAAAARAAARALPGAQRSPPSGVRPVRSGYIGS